MGIGQIGAYAGLGNTRTSASHSNSGAMDEHLAFLDRAFMLMARG